MADVDRVIEEWSRLETCGYDGFDLSCGACQRRVIVAEIERLRADVTGYYNEAATAYEQRDLHMRKRAEAEANLEAAHGVVVRLRSLVADLWLTPAGSPLLDKIETRVWDVIGNVDRSGLSDAHCNRPPVAEFIARAALAGNAKPHQHSDECWEPDSGCDMGRNEAHVRVVPRDSVPASDGHSDAAIARTCLSNLVAAVLEGRGITLAVREAKQLLGHPFAPTALGIPVVVDASLPPGTFQFRTEEQTREALRQVPPPPAPATEPWPPYPVVTCPKCGKAQTDMDGFGVVHCEACGYCTHACMTGDQCDLCGAHQPSGGL